MDIIAGRDCSQKFEDFTLEVLGARYQPGLTTDCPPAVTAWYVEPPLLNAPLTVTMKAPSSVQRGQWFDYVVAVLSTLWPYRSLECPVYLERLGSRAVWRRLNCDRLRELPANRPVQFAMRAYVPADGPSGGSGGPA